MEKFGEFILSLLVSVISLIIGGFVIMKLWLWFIVPTFEMNPLKIPEAIGIILLFTFMTIKKVKNQDTSEEMIENFFYLVIYSGLFLLIG
jgi:hypothetical protein